MANGFQSFQGFGTQPQVDLQSSEGLTTLALAQGGSVAQAAMELTHPETSILSTIGNGFKNAFTGFIDIITTPSQIVAGIISDELTVKQAMERNVSPSDVTFGKSNPNASIYKKAGSFAVRTAFDILTDPLTYLTFGTGGLFGAIGKSSITLGEKATAQLGKKVAFDKAVVSAQGQTVMNYLRKTADQASGKTSYNILKTGDETLDLAGDELDALLKATAKSDIDDRFVGNVMSSLLEKNPALAETLIDKGGVKFFGQTLVNAQQLSRTMQMIPGMSTLDVLTEQPRRALLSLVNPNYIKGADNMWVRMPSGITELAERSKNLMNARADRQMKSLQDAVHVFGLNDTEAEFLMAALEHNTLPKDERLKKAFTFMRGYSEEQWNDLVSAGLISKETRLENFAPHILKKPKLTSVSFKMPPSIKTGATELRKGATFLNQQTGEKVTGFADALGLKLSADNVFKDKLGNEFVREVAPLHELTDTDFGIIEDTLLKDKTTAAKILEEARREGFEIFDTNWFTAQAARSLKNTKAITMKEFIKDLATFGVPENQAAEGFVKISSKNINAEGSVLMQALGEEGELMFHPAIASYIERFAGSVTGDDATMDFLKSYDKLQNFWKASVTSIWPAFHGRNAISNVLQNYMDIGLNAMDPRIHTVASSLIMADRKMAKLQRDVIGGVSGAEQKLAELGNKVAFKDATGHDWTVGELRQVIKNNNVAFTSKIVNATDVTGGPEKIAKRLFKPTGLKEKAGRVLTAPVDIGQDIVGRTVEEQSRLVNFVTNLKKTGDVTMASRRTKQFLFDYSNLTNFERNVMRRIIPFYTFTRKNIELQARAIINTPGRVASQIHAVSTLGEVISGGQQLSDEEREALPDWIKSGIGIVTKRNGDQVNILTRFGTPLEAPFDQIQANNILGSVSPLLRLPVELGAGYSFFRGKPLSEVTNAASFATAPKIIKDAIGYTKIDGTRTDGSPYTWHIALHPEVMHTILNLPPTSRVFTTLKNVQDADTSTQAKIIQNLVGTKIYSFDIQQERNKRERELTTELQDLLTKAGVTAQFKRVFIPKSEKDQISF